ncbi:MAG: L-threonylcarbamoyladenylate synthase [Mycoplasmoidaceae bacterium]
MLLYNITDYHLIIKSINFNKIIIIATDTQMAVICKDPQKIYALKKRALNKPLIKFISSVDDYHFSDDFLLLAKAFFPGKLTIIENGVGYRIPNELYLLKILKEIKWIYSSSANIENQEPLTSSYDYCNYFDKEFDQEIVIVLSKIKKALPSTIYDLDQRKILRTGAISEGEILKILNNK